MTRADMLAQLKKWPRELYCDWTERAAIYEFDAKLDRHTAEMRAYWDLRPHADKPRVSIVKELRPAPEPIHDGSFFERLRAQLKEK